jgi:hypothetical protein
MYGQGKMNWDGKGRSRRKLSLFVNTLWTTIDTAWDDVGRRETSQARLSSLVDWPVYPRLAHTMRASNDAQCDPREARTSEQAIHVAASLAEEQGPLRTQVWSGSFTAAQSSAWLGSCQSSGISILASSRACSLSK